MRCHRCNQPLHILNEPCPQCGFGGDPAWLEELAHIKWVLKEIADWSGLSPHRREVLRQDYLTRQRDLEIKLGLRKPLFTHAQAIQAWPSLFHQEALLQKLNEWVGAGLLTREPLPKLVASTRRQVDDLLQQLEGRTRPVYPQTDTDRLALANFLLQAVDNLRAEDFTTLEAEQQIRASLLSVKETLEVSLGLRPPPTVPEPEPIPETATSATIVQAEVSPPVPRAPPPPLRERLWQTLLSERTLQALLFLGIFLLFAAALSFVAWGWKNFSAPLRVAIPTAFTAMFFGLGWYVRTRTRLYRSGIALSAIASLLIPIDFYTVYANFNIPPSYAPLFWFITSLVCLAAYILITFLIQNQFFGYLVGVAAGSVVLAVIQMAHQAYGFSLDWRSAGLSLLALGFTVLATPWRGKSEQSAIPRVFDSSLRSISLLAVGALLPLTLAWRYIDRPTYDTLHTSMTITWWVGGLVFGWGALQHRSRSLGLLTAISFPIAMYMTQAALFNRLEVNRAWHAFGLAWLVPLYFVAAHTWLARKDDPVLHSHGRTAATGGVILLIVAALWSLTDSGTAAAATHTVLTGAMILAALLWQRPNYLYAASLFSFSAVTFAMTELNLNFAQLSPGWTSLAILHVILALRVKDWRARPLVVAGYVIAALALLPPLLFSYNGDLLAYALGSWLGLTAWGARLAHQQQPGFIGEKASRPTAFHWLTALPLPFWIWLIFNNRGPLEADFPLALLALAWGMVALSYRLGHPEGRPWYLTGLMVSVATAVGAFVIAPDGFVPALCLLGVGLLYLADAITKRHSLELAPGGLVIAWGLVLLLDQLHLFYDGVTFALTLLVVAYFLGGLWIERRKSPVLNHRFLRPLYWAAHLIGLFILWRVYIYLLIELPWTDENQLWGAIIQVLLGIVYILYAWGTYNEMWGYISAWLIAAGGGVIILAYSTGRGSSVAKGALGVIFFILAERGLYWLRSHPGLRPRWRAMIRLAWYLYRRPWLVTGWLASAGVIGMAFVRNLWLLGGGRTQQIWAAVGLILITGLYALSARLFRRSLFVWLAALLIFAPWTILTNLGWFVTQPPTLTGFAIAWILLAWFLFLISLLVQRYASISLEARVLAGGEQAPPKDGRAAAAYTLPLKAVVHFLLPFSLLWAIADRDTSRFTFGLAIGLYALAAILDYRRTARQAVSILGQTKFLYPALGLIPIWAVYLLNWLLPMARHEHYGLLFLAFGSLGLAVGRWLRRIVFPRGVSVADGYALPAHLTGYLSLIVGTLLVAHIAPLLALALLYDALLMLISARLFYSPLWVYPAAALTPISLLIALNEAGLPENRHGWWLIGLAAVYLALAWAMRRTRLLSYHTAALTVGFALIALGLPPSSQDKIGAVWGYGSAAVLYTLTALWLRQPLLLIPACALVIVPYAIGLQLSALPPEYYGLALFPGAVIALALGWGLDRWWGAWRDFPWDKTTQWARAIVDRLLGWWGLPLYCLGFGLATVSPVFTRFQSDLTALNFLLLTPLFAWAVYRFRLRGWLLAAALAIHAAAIYYLDSLGWWAYPSAAWLRFLPVTLLTASLAIFIERRRGEGSPLEKGRWWIGWSRPLYALVLCDVLAAQLLSLSGTLAATLITLSHTLLITLLASIWLSKRMTYLSAALGVLALFQWLEVVHASREASVVALARLALAYGLVGYGLALPLPLNTLSGALRVLSEVKRWQGVVEGRKVWESTLQRFSLWFSFIILMVMSLLGLRIGVWTIRALLGYPFRQIVDLPTVQMVVGVLALLGLLYVAAAFTYRRVRWSYFAVGLLLVAWMVHAFYVQEWDGAARVQWYALPAGVYLLSIAFLEWRRGAKALARWLDYAAMLLMMGSLFWQTMLMGWVFALMLGSEGFATFWWGSARRLRRFFYAGLLGVILATVAQLINSLQSINQWIVFGIIGLLVIIIGVLVERKREEIKQWLEVLETWE